MKQLFKSGRLGIILVLALAAGVFNACKNQGNMETQLKEFLKNYDTKVAPMQKAANLAYWDAAISGKDEDYKKCEDLQNKVMKVYANKEEFAQLKKFRESKEIKDSLLKRQLEVLYLNYLGAQVDTAKLAAVIKKQNEIEKKFNTYRAEVGGKKLSDNDIDDILKKSTNSDELKEAWTSSKKIGESVANDIRDLVKLRNEIAKELGYENYHTMSLSLSEQDPKEIEALFDELDNLTRDAFAGLKTEMDEYFAKRYKIKKEELQPWHYQNRFFQEGPKIYDVDLDVYFKDKDIVKLTSDFYKGIGLPIDDMLKNSDLFEKPGKYQHAQCADIDNEGDVRVMANIKPNAQWMGTSLHEFGHAVYDKAIPNSVPFCLRQPAHTFTTEAIAMMFGRFYSNAQWLKDMVGISDAEKNKIGDITFKNLRLEQLLFSRWSQVMYRFEKAMYANPDQDLNALWWSLVEKYQMMKKPEGRNAPDWASKIHIATAPCYYHNYLMGELLASQLYYYITKNVLKSEDYKNTDFVGKPEVGAYLKSKVFEPGAIYPWNDMIQKATGEKLTAKYYATQFVK